MKSWQAYYTISLILTLSEEVTKIFAPSKSSWYVYHYWTFLYHPLHLLTFLYLNLRFSYNSSLNGILWARNTWNNWVFNQVTLCKWSLKVIFQINFYVIEIRLQCGWCPYFYIKKIRKTVKLIFTFDQISQKMVWLNIQKKVYFTVQYYYTLICLCDNYCWSLLLSLCPVVTRIAHCYLCLNTISAEAKFISQLIDYLIFLQHNAT